MSSYINNASENIISFVKKINNIDLCKSSTRSLLRKLITSLLETIQFPSKYFWITTSNNNEKNQFPMIKLYIFMHVIKFEMNSNYKNVLENCPKMMFQISCYGCLLNYRTEERIDASLCHGWTGIEICSNSNLGIGNWPMPIRLGPLQLSTNVPSSHFHEGGRRWNGSIGRLDCSARTRGQPLEPFELVNCSSQRTGTVNSPSEIPLMDRIWIYRSTRARSAAVTGFLATGPDPKYPSPCCRRVIYANLLNLHFAFRWHCKF